MSPKRTALLACLAAICVAASAQAAAAPGTGHGESGSASRAHPPHHGGPHPAHGGSWHGSYWGNTHWGWDLGLAIGVPWALGWYAPYGGAWGSVTYPPYAYGPAYGSLGYACGYDEDCWRGQLAAGEPTPPTTRIGPVPPGEEGGPVIRPLHLNYCDSARAWFPQVRTCPGGWRFIAPDHRPAP
jgi:hypothetical protein